MSRFIDRIWIIGNTCICFLLGAGAWFLSQDPFSFSFTATFYLFLASLLSFLFVPYIKHHRSHSRLKRVLSWIAGLNASAFAILILFLHWSLVGESAISDEISTKQWKEDLNSLVKTVEYHHPIKNRADELEAFKSKASSIATQLNEMTPNQKVVSFNKLIATLNDGHSSMWPFFGPANFRALPIKTFDFHDGLYVVDASSEYQSLIGSKIIGIGEFSIDQVRERIKPITGAENIIGKKVRFSLWFIQPEVLEAEGIIASPEQVPLRLLNSKGEKYEVELASESGRLWQFWSMYRPVDKRTLPFNHNLRSDFYWFELDERNNTLYLQFNLVQDKLFGGESIAELSLRLKDFVRQNNFDRFVIDLRSNNGGNSQLLHPLIDVIANDKKINREGKLFALVGRHTFSAAALFASALDNRTSAIFVGESLGTTPNFYGDAEVHVMPNSGLEYLLSYKYWQNSFNGDSRQSIGIDVPVNYTYQNFTTGYDPAIEAIVNYQRTEEPKPLRLGNFSINVKPYLGDYLLNKTQVLELALVDNKFYLSVDDFSPIGFSKMSTQLDLIKPGVYRSTDHELTLYLKEKATNKGRETISIEVEWHGVKQLLSQSELAKRMPMRLIGDQRYKEAIESLEQGMEVPEHIDLAATLNNLTQHFAKTDPTLSLRFAKYNLSKHPKSDAVK